MPDGSAEAWTFLFTDIEGSTKLWERHPDAMRPALARHDALLRNAIQANHGQVFKTIGDAFCAVFPSGPDGLHAAIQAQTALHNEPWGEIGALRVRMALHSGPAEQRENDYFGPTLNRVARFLSAGHGGQILLSQAAADSVASTLPPGAHLEDDGEHRLKDLARPERIFHLVHPDLPEEFPPLRSLEAFAHNLPIQMTSFIGREAEIAAVKERLETERLLTLLGAGGFGKTRLALQVAAEVADEYAHGVWLVDLAPLSEPNLVPQTVASVLGVREEPGRTLLETLADFLRPKTLLLLLDNCEHLITSCARLADRLLAGCPHVRILASSREALTIPGEAIFPVAPLSQPDPRRLPPLDQMLEHAAVRLFVDRAVSSQPRFALTSGNAPPVAEICRRLDGIPLAIELAAARVKVLSPEQIATRLDDRFRLLTGGARTALPRQQTLRALIDWSYDLLTEPEKILFQRLSIFAGGWSLEAAEAVGAGDPVEDWEVLDLLARLADKSLVLVEETGDEPRYRMLQTVRQYARDRLREGDEVDPVAARHRDWFLSLAEQAEPEMQGPLQAEWLDRFEAEHDNLRAALDSALQSAPEAGLRAAGALWRYWSVRGYFTEGREWLTQILDKTEAPAEPTVATADEDARQRATGRAKAYRAAGALASNQGDYVSARCLLEQGLEIWETLGDTRGAAGTLNSLGNVAWRQGDLDAARTLYEKSLAMAREMKDKRGIAVALISTGNVACQQGEYALARTLYEEALAINREIGNREWEAANLQNLGDVVWLQSDFDAARALYEEALTVRRALGDKRGIAASLGNLGNVACQQSDFERAHALYEEALAINREMGDRLWEAIELANLGDLALRQGNASAARHPYRESLEIRKDLGDRWGIANSLQSLANVAQTQGQSEWAVRVYGAADALREFIGAALPPVDRTEFEHSIADARAALGDAAFTTAWAEGRAVSLEQSIAHALEPDE